MMVTRVLALLFVLTPLGLSAQDLSPEDQSVVFFERAREAFDLGEFERANLLLREAIELNDVAPLHYNLARSLQELGQWEEAFDEYVTFLRMAPDTPERTRVEARIRIIGERIQQQHETATTEETTREATDEMPVEEARETGSVRRPSSSGWVVFGVGLAALAGGSVRTARPQRHR